MQLPVLVDIDRTTIESLPCCGVTNPAHEGRCEKNRWFKAQLKNGLRAKVLLAPDNRQRGYIEYIPGEYAWRGVDAAGYMFIHCIWTYGREYQHRGLGGRMVNACLEDAEKAGMLGVAVVARERPWLASEALFLDHGFEVVDTAPPDYELLVRKFDPASPNPAFKRDWEEKLAKYSRGFTIIRCRQCSHIAKFANEIAETAEREYGLKPRIVELRSHREAQNAPTPYAVFAIIHDGQILADHQISRTRFRNIMNRVTRPTLPPARGVRRGSR